MGSAESSVADIRAELQSYYEEEASRGLRRPSVTGPRLDLRDQFIRRLATEHRRRAVDFGAGPGRDLAGFAAAGVEAVGIDLAHGNGVLAAQAGLTVIQGSVLAPPFRPQSVDAGWSMSTLMHLPADQMAVAVGAMAGVLTDRAPLWIGMWGGDFGDRVDETIAGQKRRFFHRPLATNREILATVGTIERAEEWDFGDAGHYHAFAVCVRS